MTMLVGLLAQTVNTTTYDLARIAQMGSWWHWPLLAGVCLIVLALVLIMYRRDTRDLPLTVAVTLAGLRLFAFLGLLFTFFDLEKRTEREVVQNSRVALLIDTSQSMGLEDDDGTSSATGRRRIDQVITELSEGKLIKELRARHDLVVLRFDENEEPVELASYTKTAGNQQQAAVDESQTDDELTAALAHVRWRYLISASLGLVAVLGVLAYIVWQTPTATLPAAALLAGALLLVGGALLACVTNLQHPQITLAAVVGRQDLESLKRHIAANAIEDAPKPKPTPEPNVDWAEKLLPAGSETRLGDSLLSVLNKNRGGSLAGIVLVTDGRNNAGLPYTDAITLAQETEIPVYTVGMGSNQRPTNAALVDMEAPERVYPGDRFTITGFVQAFNMDERPARVELVSYPQGQDEASREVRVEDDRNIRLGASGALVPIKFEVEPDDEPSRRVYALRLDAPTGDRNVTDNQRQSVVQIMERRTKVLLIAGGPTREFQFLRNQLFRDKEMTVDVLLQTGKPGISQESNELLFEFPGDSDDLFKYDCIVAFDPDWQAIDEASIKLLEEWVDRQAGGLVVIAGPVYTPKWAGEHRGSLAVDLLKGLYPVVFYNRGTSLGLGRFGAEQTSRLEFTRDGLEAEFLWLGENAAESEQAWAGFEGVFGYYAVKDIKPGATIYAKFINDAEAVGDEMPVYMAGQFYGAGRVFFMASGEMWRLRQIDPAYLESFYTKLIRNVAQGRLLRDSKRGVLMIERARYKVGDGITIQARLTDAQHRPLAADKFEEVEANIRRPDGDQIPVKLRNVNAGGGELAGREGIYAGQFTALQIGDYTVKLVVPDTGNLEVLTQQITVRAPLKEIERPERNDALLSDLAQRTLGQYYLGIDEAVGRGQVPSLTSKITAKDRMTPLPDLPDKRFERLLMSWLIGLIAGALCLEWLIRRVSKLA